MPRNKSLSWILFYLILIFVLVLGIAIYLVSTFDTEEEALTEIPVPTQTEIQELDEQEQLGLSYEGLLTRNFTFEYGCQNYQISIHLFRSFYDYFSTLDKAVYSQENSLIYLERDYYGQFLLSDQDDEIIDQIVQEIGEVTNAPTTDDLAMAIISFVQNIEYDCDKLFSYESKENHEYQTNYPYETLYLNLGVCGDTTILLAKILDHIGYGTAYLIFEEDNHMALGLQCPIEHANYVQDGLGYCYVETTAPARIGVLPQEISDSDSASTRRLIKISDGNTFNKMVSIADQMDEDLNQFGEYILALTTCDEISQYKQIHDKEVLLAEFEETLSKLKAEIEPLSRNLEYDVEEYKKMGCKGTVSKSKYKICQKESNRIQSIQYTVEALILDYNNVYEEYSNLFDTYVDDFSNLEDLIAKNSTTCSGLTFGGRPADFPITNDE